MQISFNIRNQRILAIKKIVVSFIILKDLNYNKGEYFLSNYTIHLYQVNKPKFKHQTFEKL